MATQLFIAVDLGAGSGRVFLGGPDDEEFLLEEVHRFQYPPREEHGHLRWNISHIFDEIRSGLRRAASHAAELGRPIESLGIDSWAVDYGLIDPDGRLVANPVCYRDARTAGVADHVFETVSRAKIFEKTGIQFLDFNTLFQLCSEGRALDKAAKMLLLPDLINYFLTGAAASEYTNATTTQMVNATTGEWDIDLLRRVNIPKQLLTKIVPPGTILGPLLPDMETDLGLQDVRVIAPATHDTASAVAAAPLSETSAYISSGTWSLVGVELQEPLINEAVADHNFTNEGGVDGTFRFLKNVMGLWLFESCRREWKERGEAIDYDTTIAAVSARKGYGPFIFPDDPRFLNPPNMLGAIGEQLLENGFEDEDDPTTLSKIIFDSLAFRYASVLRTMVSLTGRQLKYLQILGGGGRNQYLNQMTANASGLAVRAGLTEATVVGNVLVQAVAAGRFPSICKAREYVATHVEFSEYTPEASSELEAAAKRYAEVEMKYLGSAA